MTFTRRKSRQPPSHTGAQYSPLPLICGAAAGLCRHLPLICRAAVGPCSPCLPFEEQQRACTGPCPSYVVQPMAIQPHDFHKWSRGQCNSLPLIWGAARSQYNLLLFIYLAEVGQYSPLSPRMVSSREPIQPPAFHMSSRSGPIQPPAPSYGEQQGTNTTSWFLYVEQGSSTPLCTTYV